MRLAGFVSKYYTEYQLCCYTEASEFLKYRYDAESDIVVISEAFAGLLDGKLSSQYICLGQEENVELGRVSKYQQASILMDKIISIGSRQNNISKIDFEEIRFKVLEEIDLSRDISDAEVRQIIDNMITFETYGEDDIKKELFDSIRRFDILQPLLEDDSVTEIMVNGPDEIFIEKQGHIVRYDKSFSSVERLEDIIRRIVSAVNRRVNASEPIVDARLKDGSRVNVVLPPAAIDGPILTIRKFDKGVLSMEELVANGTVTKELAEYLRLSVEDGKNIFVSGGTGSGKTTFLNALSEYIPNGQRVVTIEDSAELNIRHVSNLVRLEVRNANSEGSHEITIRELIKTSLRMRPDRIIVGEVRDAACMDMLQAMLTGHKGCMSTGHGSSIPDMIFRLETMAIMAEALPIEAIRGQIGSALDIIVHMARLPDGSRKVVEISEVKGYDRKEGEIKLNNIYRCEEAAAG